MRRLPAHVRLVALTLAATWALAPFATAAHSGTHVHRYCAEHRTIEEGSDAAVDPTDDGGTPLVALDPTADPVERFAHVRCPLSPPSANELGAAAELRSASLVPSLSPILGMDWRSEHAPIHHLALAPKSSPPRTSAVLVA
jgi:hypothetical protein